METDFSRGIEGSSDTSQSRPEDPAPSQTHDDGRSETSRGGRSQGNGAARGRRSQGRTLAKSLGWFSVGLGAAELLAPRGVARLIGLTPTPVTSTVLRLLGGREVATGLGIIANPSSKEWVGMRIGGDLLDLALLGVALAKSTAPARTIAATMAVLGVSALDAAGTERLAEARKVQPAAKDDADRGVTPVVRSITVERPVDEVYAFWSDFANFPRFMEHVESVQVLDERRSRWRATGPAGSSVEWESEIVARRPGELIAWHTADGSDLYHSGAVRFHPVGDATVVTVELEYSPPGGRIASAALKLFRKEPGQQVGDDLRRFKQVMEIGEVLQSDSSTSRKPRPARPPEQQDEQHTAEGAAQESVS